MSAFYSCAHWTVTGIYVSSKRGWYKWAIFCKVSLNLPSCPLSWKGLFWRWQALYGSRLVCGSAVCTMATCPIICEFRHQNTVVSTIWGCGAHAMGKSVDRKQICWMSALSPSDNVDCGRQVLVKGVGHDEGFPLLPPLVVSGGGVCLPEKHLAKTTCNCSHKMIMLGPYSCDL